MVRVLGVAAGGHAKVVIDILRLVGSCEVVGLLDVNDKLWGREVLGIPVLGGDDLLLRLREEGVDHAFIGLGTVGDTRPRWRLYEKVIAAGYHVVQAIHPCATVASSVEIGCGPTIMAGAVINAAARLGDNVIVNTGAIVEHDCIVGDHVHIATGARLASTVKVGNGAHIGAGATIKQYMRIGEAAIVGAGAVVVRDVPPCSVVTGVPARVVRNA